MKIGLIPNTSKANVRELLRMIISKLDDRYLDYSISNNIYDEFNEGEINPKLFLPNEELFKTSDIIVSLGGDGTMLNTAFHARNYNTALAGVNFGKLGFLAEIDLSNLEDFLDYIKNENYTIDERIALDGISSQKSDEEKLYAINDIVIDKGHWPKMIEITLKVDDDYVSTFSADGIIIATPTGSTGYSLSVGGPIVSPNSDAITISPISPHTLTMRPLVVSSNQKIIVEIRVPNKQVQVSCDGQRVYDYKAPVKIEITKSIHPVRLVHVPGNNYYQILRNKLFWGLDIRNENLDKDK